MLFWILLAALVLITLIVRSRHVYDKNFVTFGTLGVGAVCIALVLLIVGFIVPPQEFARDNRECPILSLKAQQGIHGEFYMGCGIIDSQDSYVFYRPVDGGGIMRDSVPCRRSRVFEGDWPTPKMTWRRVFYRVNKKIIPWNMQVWEEDTQYYLYVPKGTVILQFNVK